MSNIGPTLPPHLLAKRKRKEKEEEEEIVVTASNKKPSPSPPRVSDKKRRVVGPTMPPAPLNERPDLLHQQQDESSSEDDDEFGPSLPPAGTNFNESDDEHNGTNDPPTKPQVSSELRRDEWMMMPPKQDDLAARMDPTRRRPQGFSTGKGAKAPGRADDDGSAWYETVEQKQKRLADEMMGVPQPAAVVSKRSPQVPTTATPKDLRETHRGPSLVDRHQKTKGPEAQVDDPSRRTFDREKDMGAGMRIGHVQREELLRKASDYGSKFAGGSYL